MSDLIDDVPETLTAKVNGTSYELKRLTSYDRANLLRADRKARRDQLLQDAKDAGVTDSVVIFDTLRDFDAREKEVDVGESWPKYVNDATNEPAIVLASLRKTLSAEDAERIAPEIELDIAKKAALCGLSLVTRGPDQKSGDEENPTNLPPAYGRGTGTESGA